MIWAFGDDLPTGPTPLSDAQRQGAAAGLQFLIDGVRYGWIGQPTLGFTESGSLDAFQQRKVVLLRHWPDAWLSLATPRAGTLGVARLPGPSVLGGESLAVAACSRHRSSALRLIEFLTREETQRYLFDDGLYLPTRARLYEGGLLGKPGRKVPEGFVRVVRESLATAQPRPAVPDYLRTSQVIQDLVHDRLRKVTARSPGRTRSPPRSGDPAAVDEHRRAAQ